MVFETMSIGISRRVTCCGWPTGLTASTLLPVICNRIEGQDKRTRVMPKSKFCSLFCPVHDSKSTVFVIRRERHKHVQRIRRTAAADLWFPRIPRAAG